MPASNAFNIPSSSSTVQVSIIDTTFDGKVPTAPFMGPPIKGFDIWRPVAYCFLVVHTDASGTQRRVIFDLGSPKDMVNDFPPDIAKSIEDLVRDVGGHLSVKKDVAEILTDNHVTLEKIETIIWSHAHTDHIGRPSLFPSTTSLVVGPDIKRTFYPGYPAVPESPVLAREFEGREVQELDFGNSDLEIAGLAAIDYFNDGSFYLLSAPGHSIGHINALARTTEGTFIYFAADSFHHPSQIRPSIDSRLPTFIQMQDYCCSRTAYYDIHPSKNFSNIPDHYHVPLGYPHATPDDSAFHTVAETPGGPNLSNDLQAARNTIAAVQKLDSDPNILVIAAHDTSLHGILDFFPDGANEWKEKDWKKKGQWQFLRDFDKALEHSLQESGRRRRSSAGFRAPPAPEG